jgi:hypothetical protein
LPGAAGITLGFSRFSRFPRTKNPVDLNQSDCGVARKQLPRFQFIPIVSNLEQCPYDRRFTFTGEVVARFHDR